MAYRINQSATLGVAVRSPTQSRLRYPVAQSSHARGLLGHIRQAAQELDLLEFLEVPPESLEGIPYAGLVPPGEEMREEHLGCS